jgi:hypothetical protein
MTLDPTVLPLLRAWPAVMRRLVDTAPEAARMESDRADDGDGWTAKDVIAHLADVQMWGYADRIAHMLTRKSPTFQGYDEAERLDESGLRDGSLDDVLKAFEMRRRWTLGMLEAADPSGLDRTAQHSELGEIRVSHIGHVWAYHDLVHLRQVASFLQRPLWARMRNTRRFSDPQSPVPADPSAPSIDPQAISTLTAMPEIVRSIIDLLPDDRAEEPVAGLSQTDAWSPRDVVAHLLESQRVGFAGRISTILTTDTPGFDDRDAARDLDASGYRDQTAHELLEIWETQRLEAVEHAADLSHDQLIRSGEHATVGTLTVADLVHEWAHHDLEHLQHLCTMLEPPLLEGAGPFEAYYR